MQQNRTAKLVLLINQPEGRRGGWAKWPLPNDFPNDCTKKIELLHVSSFGLPAIKFYSLGLLLWQKSFHYMSALFSTIFDFSKMLLKKIGANFLNSISYLKHIAAFRVKSRDSEIHISCVPGSC